MHEGTEIGKRKGGRRRTQTLGASPFQVGIPGWNVFKGSEIFHEKFKESENFVEKFKGSEIFLENYKGFENLCEMLRRREIFVVENKLLISSHTQKFSCKKMISEK